MNNGLPGTNTVGQIGIIVREIGRVAKRANIQASVTPATIPSTR